MSATANASLPQVVRFGRETCGDLREAERREWWLANGLGGYAAGTIAGTLTRRYHGLLIAPVNPPLGRVLVFAKADATVHDGERHYPLFANRWADGSIDPRGFVTIESFRLDGGMPVWRFALGDVIVEQRIFMEHGANRTYVAYRLEPESMTTPRELALSITLLVNARDHHATSAARSFDPQLAADGARLAVRHGDWFTLRFAAQHGTIEARRDWYENFDLRSERERGLGDRDNHLCVGVARLPLVEGRWTGVMASLDEPGTVDIEQALSRSRQRQQRQLTITKESVPEFAHAPEWIDQLVLAADTFVFARPLEGLPEGESIIAGYPWFGDWGRDTMITLPGLTLATGRFETASRILRTFARFVDRGMLPNVFPGPGDKPEYNTVDAALWYIEAWRAYVGASSDLAALRNVFPVLEDIVDWHVQGTRYRIGVDAADGLLHAGEAGVQLTWMDAKLGDWVVTPRTGKAVEINALWFNALSTMAQFADLLGARADEYRLLAERARIGFGRFVDRANGGLYDVLDAPGCDATVRPNQIFAVSLPYSPLNPEQQRGVVSVVTRELLTSYGLRSLEPSHPAFSAHYDGGAWQRDASYHQGPVWAWLLGHYAVAELRVYGDPARAQRRLQPLRDHLLDAGLGSVSEIFDGGTPHLPRGCPSQAWSVACTLEAWWRLQQRMTTLDVPAQSRRRASARRVEIEEASK